jgi:ubiquinone biosynthesis protein COQ9
MDCFVVTLLAMTVNMVSPKDKILAAALPSVPFDGWDAAVRSQELWEVYFPRGGIDAIAHHSRLGDAQMAEAVSQLPLATMKIPQKIKAAVMLRLRQQQPHREAIRKALGILSFPTHTAESLQLLSETVDTIWRSTGDVTADFNWYTKRMTLAGVYSATVLFWLNDESEALAETEAFLTRRLGDVARFGKTKKKVTDFFKSVIPANPRK